MAQRSEKRLSDQELANTDLRISDPMALPNLSEERPDPDLPSEIVGDYDVTPPGGRSANPDGPWLRCSHCAKTQHWVGIVVSNENGKNHLIGSRCGRDHYGASFTGMRNRFREEGQRRSTLLRLRWFAENLSAAREVAMGITRCKSLSEIDLKRIDLKKAPGGFYTQLRSFVLAGRQLTEIVKVRDLAAEQSRKGDSDVPIYTRQEVPIAPLSGKMLFMENDDLRSRIREFHEASRPVLAFVKNGTDGTKTSELNRTVRKLEEAWDRVGESRQLALAVPSFFSGASLGHLERWAAGHNAFSVSSEKRTLIVRTDRKEERITGLPKMNIPDWPSRTTATDME